MRDILLFLTPWGALRLWGIIKIGRAVERRVWESTLEAKPMTDTTPNNLFTDELLNYKDVMKKMRCSRAGIDATVRFHDLRHTSLNAAANELGAPVKATQKRARHSQATTTMNVYGGDTSGAVDAELAEKLDQWIFDEEER